MSVHPEIVVFAGGFTLRSLKKPVSVEFRDVYAIHAKKMDLLTVDEIRVTFERRNAVPVEVSEELSGFDDLMNKVLTWFRGSDGQWFRKVAQPAFAPSATVVWKEEPNSESSVSQQPTQDSG
jgi:hypothetical protein